MQLSSSQLPTSSRTARGLGPHRHPQQHFPPPHQHRRPCLNRCQLCPPPPLPVRATWDHLPTPILTHPTTLAIILASTTSKLPSAPLVVLRTVLGISSLAILTWGLAVSLTLVSHLSIATHQARVWGTVPSSPITPVKRIFPLWVERMDTPPDIRVDLHYSSSREAYRDRASRINRASTPWCLPTTRQIFSAMGVSHRMASFLPHPTIPVSFLLLAPTLAISPH